MRSNGHEISLKDAVKFIVDNRGKTAPTAEFGIALIATNCVNNEDLYPKKRNVRYVSNETYQSWFRSHPEAGDILLTNKGSQNGAVCLVPENVDFCIAQDMVALRADENKIYPLFLFAALRSELVQKRIKALNVDAVIPHLKKTDFDKLFIPLPDERVQRFAGDWYFQVSCRIELLRETNATLEAIAQALFKSWFVDFDPVHANINAAAEGRAAPAAANPNSATDAAQNQPHTNTTAATNNSHPATTPAALDPATAALFPNSFQDSELGLIPHGWSYSTVGESFILTMGQSPHGDTYNEIGEGLPFYQGRTDFGFRFPTKRMFCTAPTRHAGVGDTLVSVRAPVGDVNMAIEPCCIGRGVASVRHPDGYRGFAFYAMRSLENKFKDFDSEGTVFGAINKNDFQKLPVISCNNFVLKAFDELTAPIDQRIIENEVLIRTLTQLRDTLLPRLISGQLRLPEAQEKIEEALV